jgi:hypothetical protein
MIYAEEKEPPSRSFHVMDAVRIALDWFGGSYAAGSCRFFPAGVELTGVLSE